MKRLLLDTNIYGIIVEKQEREEFQDLTKNSNIVIYGCSVIRKELRATPKEKYITTTKEGVRNFRLLLLNIYDAVTKNHEIHIDAKTEELTDKYLHYFSKITGKIILGHLINDFLLVACASINKLDLIVSEDHKTLLSLDAIKTYHFINAQEDLTVPNALTYQQLKEILKRSFPS